MKARSWKTTLSSIFIALAMLYKPIIVEHRPPDLSEITAVGGVLGLGINSKDSDVTGAAETAHRLQ